MKCLNKYIRIKKDPINTECTSKQKEKYSRN